jgi:hypothetical protein
MLLVFFEKFFIPHLIEVFVVEESLRPNLGKWQKGQGLEF